MIDILIIDDNIEQANLLKLLMEQYGYRADYITESTQAIKTIRNLKPALVILDLMMPELDGLRVCRQIKEDPNISDTKIVIYSGKMYESDRRRALELGADAFFVKPTRAYLLINKIRELLHPIENETIKN